MDTDKNINIVNEDEYEEKTFEVYFDFADRCSIETYKYGTPKSKINEDYEKWKEDQMNNVTQGWSLRSSFKEGMIDYDK